jgi:hypothetical protein
MSQRVLNSSLRNRTHRTDETKTLLSLLFKIKSSPLSFFFSFYFILFVALLLIQEVEKVIGAYWYHLLRAFCLVSLNDAPWGRNLRFRIYRANTALGPFLHIKKKQKTKEDDLQSVWRGKHRVRCLLNSCEHLPISISCSLSFCLPLFLKILFKKLSLIWTVEIPGRPCASALVFTMYNYQKHTNIRNVKTLLVSGCA